GGRAGLLLRGGEGVPVVAVRAPARRVPLRGAGDRVVERPVPGFGQVGALQQLVRAVVPVPALARLEAADQRVAGRAEVRGRVLGRRRVAAADVAALRAPAQVDPPAAHVVALAAARAARGGGEVDP